MNAYGNDDRVTTLSSRKAFPLLVGAAQALTRDGFDMQRHALSLLSNGDLGWIQIANFMHD